MERERTRDAPDSGSSGLRHTEPPFMSGRPDERGPQLMAATAERKRRLRAELRARLAAVGPDEADLAGRAALVHLEADAVWRGARRIGLFASADGEPATRAIFEAALTAGLDVLMPRCLDVTEMVFAPVSDWDALEPGRYGLREPAAPAVHDVWEPGDLVLVPGLGFDERGGRLGRGAGHFDRFFATTGHGAPWLLGFGFALQLEREIPMEGHDRRLDGVLTERGLVWGPGQRGAAGAREHDPSSTS